MHALDERALARLARAAEAGLARRVPPVRWIDPTRYDLDGHRVVGFCSNDYLGYGTEPVALEATSGATASRLVCGDHDDVRAAEAALAEFAGTEAAVLYPSGYQANVAALSCLLEADDVVYSDRLNHASLIDGIRLSPARPTILPHLDAPPSPASHATPPPFWVTEAVFSMDGDHPAPDDLRAFARSGGLLYLDEAHAAGIYGEGRGFAHAHAVEPAVRLFTLGKALGHVGGAVLTSAPVAELLRTTSRGFVFSTGVSPLGARVVRHTLARLSGPDGANRRRRLWDNVRRLGAHLGEPDPPSPIFPVVVGANAHVTEAAASLLTRGFHVQPIRPPTVPPGTARLRITVTAAHEPEQIDALAEALTDVLRPLGVPAVVTRGLVAPAP